ncbi:Hypothetical protein SCLAV_p1164 (plasmid) [Streptomyces clavuligerus]|uniref:Uncharacterized protein n=3 Tax=Streptomyces clavuligerus TaxID=1901 RepID=D5SL57_STRCL|nr:Hypothetical protein SCLAV_p1164 [Streptomyces clavuligerus]
MVLAWPGDPALPENGLQLIAHRLTGAAHAVVDDLRYAAGRLPDTHPARALTDAVLHDTRRILHLPVEGTVHCARHRAHMVRALYGYLDRLDPTERP